MTGDSSVGAGSEQAHDHDLTWRSRFYVLGVVGVYTGAFVILWFPVMFLATGVQAIGHAAGWWIGDPNSNDGEEVLSTAIGLIGTLPIMALATAMTMFFAFVFGRSTKSAVRAVAAGTLAVVAAHTVWALWAFNH